MQTQTFEKRLEEKRSETLYGGWLSKFQHIERMGHEEVEGVLSGEVIVQTKLDGANLTVARDPEKGMVIASRNQAISVGGNPPNGFQGAVEYVLAHQGIQEVVCSGDFVLRGEWLVKHSLTYREDVYRHLYVFDVEDPDGTYLHPDHFLPMLERHGIKTIPILARLTNPTLEDLLPLVVGPDEFGAKQKEGVVIKNYGFKNRWDRTTWGKVVSADFKEKNKLSFGASRSDGHELRFAAQITNEDILKVIHKIRDEKGAVSVKNMFEVIGRVWYDHFSDNLWDFIKDERVTTFDFKEARRLVETKARDTALSFFNGIPSIHDS